jgi:hypothetical protein
LHGCDSSHAESALSFGPGGKSRTHKHAVDGAGVLTSLMEISGIVEPRELVTAVSLGDNVGYLPYQCLL